MSLRFSWSRTILFIATVTSIIALPNLTPLFAGEPQWVEVRSPNFSVVTDAGEKRGREVAMRFEQMRAVFGALMTNSKVNLPVPLQIVAFRNAKEWRQFAPLFNGKPIEAAGLFQQGSDRSFILLDMATENPWTVVFHEYAHQLMNGNLQGEFAPWLQEGFAEYFSSIEVDGKEARVGKIPADEYTILQQVGMMKVADLFRVQQNSKIYNENGDHRTTFYAESSIVVHYIFDNRLMLQVGTYFDLRENKHLEVEDAIQQAFGMSASQFDKVLRNYVVSRQYRYYPIPAPANLAPGSYTALALSEVAANAVLADVHLHSRDYQERAIGEFQEILKTDPNNSAAYRGLGYAYLQKQDFTKAAEYFRRASQLDTSDPRVHYYNALLMYREGGMGGGNQSAMIRELESSLSLDPNFADSYALLAFAQSTSGDPATALITMRKAITINPRNEHYRLNLANLYLANRQPDHAIALLQALRNSADPAVASHAAEMLGQAVQFQALINQPSESNGNPIVDRSTPPEGKEERSVPAAAPSGPVKFLSGTLTIADCSKPPSASLTVVSGSTTFTMTVADRNHVVLIGANEFSCGWNKQKVALNYRETSAREGNVVSLEIQ